MQKVSRGYYLPSDIRKDGLLRMKKLVERDLMASASPIATCIEPPPTPGLSLAKLMGVRRLLEEHAVPMDEGLSINADAGGVEFIKRNVEGCYPDLAGGQIRRIAGFDIKEDASLKPGLVEVRDAAGTVLHRFRYV